MDLKIKKKEIWLEKKKGESSKTALKLIPYWLIEKEKKKNGQWEVGLCVSDMYFNFPHILMGSILLFP